MNITESIRLSLEGLRANKMRSLLTMLGIIIGIGSVIAILTVGNAMSNTVTSSISSLGASNVNMTVQQRSREGIRTSLQAKDRITDEMIQAFREKYPREVEAISISENAGSGQAKDGRKYANISAIGVSESYNLVNNVTMLQGREINQKDSEGTRMVAVVSDKFVNKMFNGDIPLAIGQETKVQIGREIHVFRIVGVYEYEQSIMNMSFSSEDDLTTSLYIPYNTAKRITGSSSGLVSFTFMVNKDVDSTAFSLIAEDFFNERYYANNPDYYIGAISMEAITDQVNTMMSTMSIAISVIAGISLLVGGIGVMNIMLVSVTERTREIGTRKALGATNANIRIQFVVESIIVCVIGGLIGVLLGGVLGYIGSNLLGNASLPTLASVLLAVCFSMAIGVFFGYYPANKAAMLDPIEALRYE